MPLYLTLSLLAVALLLCATEIRAGDAKLDIQIKDVKKQFTLVMRKKIKHADIGATLGQMYGQIGAYARPKGIKMLYAPFALYKEGVGDEFEIEGGMVVAEGSKGEGAVLSAELPAGKAAYAIHVGPYEKLSETCDKMNAFLKEKGLKGKGLLWEFYISDPGNTKPEELKTEIYMLIDETK